MGSDPSENAEIRGTNNDSREKTIPKPLADFLKTLGKGQRKNYRTLLLRIWPHYDFLSPDKTVEDLVQIIKQTARKKPLEGSTLRVYLTWIRLFCGWWAGWDKDRLIAAKEQRILKHQEGDYQRNDFILALLKRQKKVPVREIDPAEKYSPRVVGRLTSIILKLPIPIEHKTLIEMAEITGRRRKALASFDLEHIQIVTKEKVMTGYEFYSQYLTDDSLEILNIQLRFYEKGKKVDIYEPTNQEWLKIVDWLDFRKKEEAIHGEMVDINPETNQKGHYFFWNAWHRRFTPEAISDYFYKLSQRAICPNCQRHFLSDYELEKKICELCKEPFTDPFFVDFHIHMKRGELASKLSEAGMTKDDIKAAYGWRSDAIDRYLAPDKKIARERARKIKEGIITCSKCRNIVPTGSNFCPNCGAPIN